MVLNMSKHLFISDFFLNETLGGSEIVDNTLINHLNCDFVKSENFIPNNNKTLIISNTSRMKESSIRYIENNCNYIIIEHDYKIHWTRHPWRFENNIVPEKERINYNLYKNAKAIFVQTDDHLEIFKKNEVPGNFISLKSSIWSDKELDQLNEARKQKFTHKFAIIDSDNWIKNKKGAEQFCKFNKLDYELIPKLPHDQFLKELARHPVLVFFPVARETCCKLIVEARCMEMNVITNNNSGAFKSEWYSKTGNDLINYLRGQSKINLDLIKSFVNS